jgi:PhzF family phenazine biosynthesis protein
MKLKIYQIDAFADKVFAGNPAAIVPLEAWLSEEQMQKIAAENNLAETAFFVKNKKGFYIRWFTPTVEIALCGHATLASAYVLFEILGYKEESVVFKCKSGILNVTKNESWLTLNFPSDKISPIDLSSDFQASLGKSPVEAYLGSNGYVVLVFPNQEDIASMQPDFFSLMEIKAKVITVTSKGNDVDFVSRVFGPAVGINEDPVTGSAHTRLIPFWSERLGKKELSARQISTRGGYLKCKMLGERVEMSGQAVLYLTGEIYI